jgi:hypothetical protein
MPTKDTNQSVVDSEREVLRALRRGALDSRGSLKGLQGYRWHEPLHQVIFDFLVSMPGANSDLMGEQLPTYLTRRGFPDFDLSWFQPHALVENDLERLIEHLKRAGAPPGRTRRNSK